MLKLTLEVTFGIRLDLFGGTRDVAPLLGFDIDADGEQDIVVPTQGFAPEPVSGSMRLMRIAIAGAGVAGMVRGGQRLEPGIPARV